MNKFKSNIKCGACVAAVTPSLDELAGKGKWKVDLTHPDRIVTVEEASAEELNAKLKPIGYSVDALE